VTLIAGRPLGSFLAAHPDALVVAVKARQAEPNSPVPGECCEEMKNLWKARNYCAVGQSIWTENGITDPHCPFCLAPIGKESP
jgi:hypothetical protein